MAPSSLPFPAATSHNPKADQIISRYLHKVVLVIANARLTNDSPESQDSSAPGTPGLSNSDGPGGRGAYIMAGEDDGSGTPTGSITAVHPSRAESSSSKPVVKKRQAGPKVDKWFNLEVPDSDTFKKSLHVFRSISTSFPITPYENVVDPPPLIIQVLLSIPQPALNQVLVLTHSNQRTRIDPTPRYILLESWRVDITRPSSSHDQPSSSASSASSHSESSTSGSSVFDVELPTVYKQSIALFRSVYSLLRVLPTWKLRRQLRRRTRTGLGGGMSLELRVEVPSTESSRGSSSSSTAASVDDLPPHIDNVPIIDFNAPLSQYVTANRVEKLSFPSIASPLGYLNLSLKYRTQTNFALESLEGLLSSGFDSVDYGQNQGDSTTLPAVELYSIPPNPPPNYPRPPYPPVVHAIARDEHEKERRIRGGLSRSPPAVRMPAALEFDRHPRELSAVQEERDRLERERAEEREFEMVSAAFTPTVVIEQQRRRRESQDAAALGLGGVTAVNFNLGGRTPLGSLPNRTTLSPHSQPASLPREPLAVPTSGTSVGSDKDVNRTSPSGSTYSVTGTGGIQPARSRYNSIPHSSSPLNNSPRLGGQRVSILPQSSSISPMATPTQHGQAQLLPTIPQYGPPPVHTTPVHTRTTSMPSSASRPSPLTVPSSSAAMSPAPASATGRFAFARTEDLPFASSASGLASMSRRRKESAGAMSSTSSAGGMVPGMTPSPTRPSYSPRSRPLGLPPLSPAPTAPAFTVRSPSSQVTPPNAVSGAVPLPSPRRPSLNTIHPFKSSTLSSSPGSFGAAGRLHSPLSERAAAGLPIPAVSGNVRQPGVAVGSQSPRSPTITAADPAGDGLTSKRLSSGSLEVGKPGLVRRVSGYSPELPSAGVGTPPTGTAAMPMSKRYSSSFGHRYGASISGAASGAGVSGSGGSGGIGLIDAGGPSVPVGSAGSGGSGGRRDSLGLAGVPSAALPPTLERPVDDKNCTTDDDDIGAFVRAIDSRPQLRGGLTPSRLSGSPASDPSIGSLPRGGGSSTFPARLESNLSGSGETGRTSAAYVSAYDTLSGRTTREPSEDVSSDMGSIGTTGRTSGIAMPTSRMDVDDRLRRMQEDFARGLDSATNARRQQQVVSSPRGSTFTTPPPSAVTVGDSPRGDGEDQSRSEPTLERADDGKQVEDRLEDVWFRDETDEKLEFER
ncbi:hypothetical protein FRB97_008819 [Tulasnella sp. 331]|nr:hypothetical protein FRB97_008819 [Tulasnella sp. 331]